ncbi:MAG: iron ABC transporter permease [Loktanella sp.]|nr:iron ABC transporter permease [Loktanella sp.]
MADTFTPGLRARRLANRARQVRANPALWIGAILLVVFGYLIAAPMLEIATGSARVQDGDARRAGADIGTWTAYYWHRLVASPLAETLLYTPLRNTLVISAVYSVIAMVMGVGLAFLMVKTDLPFKRAISVAILVPYIVPSWTVALAWTTLFGNDRVGIGAPGVVMSLTGWTTPDWLAYGPVPIIAVMAFNYYAFSYLLTVGALSTIDRGLEESAQLHGASERTIARRITLPLILPALGSAFVLTFAEGIGSFGPAAILGIPVRYDVLATSLYQSAAIGRFGEAYVLTLLLIVMAAVTIYANTLLIGRRRSFTTLTGKGGSARVIPLGRWRMPLLVLVLAFVGIAAVLPIVLLIWQSLQLRIGDYSLSNLSLAYWIGEVDGLRGILVDPRVQSAAWNSLRLGLMVAVLTALTGILVGYVVVNRRGTWLARGVEQLAFVPYVIPGIAFGAIYLTMFAQPIGPLPSLYGTLWILVLAASVNRLPFASRTGVSAMMQISPSLEEAATLHGAGLGTRMRRILLPLSKKGFLAGFVLSFISTIKDLSLVILLVTPSTNVLTALTFGYIELGRRQFADAISVVIVIIVLGATWGVQWATRTDPLQGFGDTRT